MLADIALSQLWNSPLEMFAVITGVICVGLITFEDRSKRLAWWNWPIGILTSAAYVWIFWQYQLYFNSALQLFYVVTGFYGGWAWLRGGEQKTRLPISRMSNIRFFAYTALCVVGAMLLAALLDNLGVASAAPYWDALVVLFSLTAQFIMTRKYLEHWHFWMAVDVIGVFLFASQDLYLTAVLYFIYGCLVVRGMVTWHRAYNNEQEVTITTDPIIPTQIEP